MKLPAEGFIAAMYCVLWTSLGVSLVLQYLVMMVIAMVILVRTMMMIMT